MYSEAESDKDHLIVGWESFFYFANILMFAIHKTLMNHEIPY